MKGEAEMYTDSKTNLRGMESIKFWCKLLQLWNISVFNLLQNRVNARERGNREEIYDCRENQRERVSSGNARGQEKYSRPSTGTRTTKLPCVRIRFSIFSLEYLIAFSHYRS
jgi:hypothetical protein